MLDTVGNVWFGVTMMVLILVYAWIGSAGIPVWTEERFWFVRQTFEKTEMEWFRWWPFNVLLAALTLALILVTIRKIKLNLPNLGVWTVHSGILILMLGCAIYFGNKIEGDMAVYRRQAVVTVPGGTGSLILRPGEQTVVRGDDRAYRVDVANLNPSYELLTGEDAGETTYAAQLRFTPVGGGPVSEPFVRQLLVGYPQYTEDVLPGRGRAVKAIGRKLVDEVLEVELAYVPTDTIHLRDEMSLYARLPGEERWSEMPLPSLPRYREHVSSPEDLWQPPGGPRAQYPPLELSGDWKDRGGLDGKNLSAVVTGFLPFAHLVERWEPGGGRFNPFARVTVTVGGSTFHEELLAKVPGRNRVALADGLLTASFKWLADESELAGYLEPREPRLVVRVPAAGVRRTIPLEELMAREVPITGTGYRLKGLELYPSWTLASTGEPASMVLVDVSGGGPRFRRAVVYPRAELSQDLDDSGTRHQGLLDDGIRMELENVPESGLLIVGGAAGLHVLLVSQGGEVLHEAAQAGVPVSLLDGGLTVTVDALDERSRPVARPMLIPSRERDLKAGPFYSMIQVRVDDGQASESMWLPYSHYSHPSVLGFRPRTVTLPDGRQIELLFSRETYKMPVPVVLESFQLETYPGREQERDYISLVRFVEEGEASELHEVRSNQPTEHLGWWFFQATWDPPRPQMGHAGMNYTGIGVGNRHGVLVMLLGSALTVLGTLYAFYVKPVVLRRLRDKGRARARRTTAAPPLEDVAAVASVSER